MTQRNYLTQADIEATVRRADYHLFPGTTTTVCCLVLANGFTVTGESACADPANFDAEIGRQYAFRDAIGKVWRLEGYLLKERMNPARIHAAA